MVMNEIEDAIMRRFEDLKIGEIILDGAMINLHTIFPNVPATTLGEHIRGLMDKDMIERVENGYKLKERGYIYLHPHGLHQ